MQVSLGRRALVRPAGCGRLEGEAGEKMIRLWGACQLRAAASCLLLWAGCCLAAPSWKVLRGGAAATVPAQPEEEVGGRGRVGTGPWHRKSRLPQEAWHQDNPLPKQELYQGGAKMQYPDLHTPSLHYGQGRAPEANGIRIYRSQLRDAQHCTNSQKAVELQSLGGSPFRATN